VAGAFSLAQADSSAAVAHSIGRVKRGFIVVLLK
jgi:hypothetical protein